MPTKDVRKKVSTKAVKSKITLATRKRMSLAQKKRYRSPIVSKSLEEVLRKLRSSSRMRLRK